MLKAIKLKDYFFKKKIRYWRKHPAEFCEEYMGCKLSICDLNDVRWL